MVIVDPAYVFDCVLNGMIADGAIQMPNNQTPIAQLDEWIDRFLMGTGLTVDEVMTVMQTEMDLQQRVYALYVVGEENVMHYYRIGAAQQ